MNETEKIVFSNSFGTITSHRLTLNYKNGKEDIPLSQITSISYQHYRNYFYSLISLVVVIVCLFIFITYGTMIGSSEILILLLFLLITLLSGLANWVGHHNIIISVGGQNRQPLKVEMSKNKEGLDFMSAARNQIIIK